MIENFLKVLNILKGTVSEEFPLCLNESQIECLVAKCSEQEIDDFRKSIGDYITSTTGHKNIDNFQFLIESECPKNPYRENFYKISVNTLYDMEKQILILIQDISIIGKSDNLIICKEEEFLSVIQDIKINNRIKDTRLEKEDEEPLVIKDDKCLKDVTKVMRTSYEQINDHNTTFFDSVTKIAKEMVNSYNNYPITYREEEISKLLDKETQQYQEFHKENITVYNYLANINELYYNGFITEKGYFIETEINGYFMGIANGNNKNGIQMKLFSKKDLLEYASVFKDYRTTVRYINKRDIQTIIERGN